MKIRTYYWNEKKVQYHRYIMKKIKYKYKKLDHYTQILKYGNAGDIFANNIISNNYGIKSVNIENEGKRLLLVGSIASKILAGDLVCGIGVKSPESVPNIKDKESVFILGVRGPLTFRSLKESGYQMNNVKFMFDPGLLIKYYIKKNISTIKNRIGFIPHYRERSYYHKNKIKNIKIINIDNNPILLAHEILKCELVYSSSLHGLIFSHALSRPSIFVAPKTKEPLFKYEDYYLSLGKNMPAPIDNIYATKLIKKPLSPINIKYSKESFHLPTFEYLDNNGYTKL